MMPLGIEQYNWPKFVALAIFSLFIALGTKLESPATSRQIFAATLLALGNFGWGYFTDNSKKAGR